MIQVSAAVNIAQRRRKTIDRSEVGRPLGFHVGFPMRSLVKLSRAQNGISLVATQSDGDEDRKLTVVIEGNVSRVFWQRQT
jgi:hypothetical protein